MPHSRQLPILLLDDDPFMLKLLARLLEQAGYKQLIACERSQDALRKLEEVARIDVIILDVNMPDMDGVEFIRELAQRRYAGSIILVTGEQEAIRDSVGRLLEAQQLRLLGALPKPVRRDALEALLLKLQPSSRGRVAGGAARSYSAEELRAAITRGELINHYQPKATLNAGQVTGVEALVRWQHPSDGLLPPARFLDAAVSHGLMREVTRAVLRMAMDQSRAWSQAGLQLAVAVNISMDDLITLDFPDVIASMARAAAVQARTVTLEVTEGQVMQNFTATLDVLSRLRLKRFHLAIDDFGTGHSSLAQLRDLPFDELKVDRGFVHGAARDAKLRAICDASLRMARQLRMQVVGEGIEDAEDWEFLQQLGCDIGQGYLIAKPMPADDIIPWLAEWNAGKRVHGS
jgi:EAL domain-containing protein (putative c-di-GMP-specific phosphodiesterase class I)/ActR/RegA family two-component response regulator